jgi:hypothetical protein
VNKRPKWPGPGTSPEAEEGGPWELYVPWAITDESIPALTRDWGHVIWSNRHGMIAYTWDEGDIGMYVWAAAPLESCCIDHVRIPTPGWRPVTMKSFSGAAKAYDAGAYDLYWHRATKDIGPPPEAA